MLVTIQEAADALSVHKCTLLRWLGEDYNLPVRWAVDTEHVCEVLNMDHRFMMAFLAGYDISLPLKTVRKLTKLGNTALRSHLQPVFVRPRTDGLRLGDRRACRYSHRQVASYLVQRFKEDHPHARKRTSAFGGRGLRPSPDQMPIDSWKFVSTLTTEGKPMPRAIKTRFRHDPPSVLPVLDRIDRTT